MSKYLNTKPGSLESAVLEAVSPAQQAAIAISKKEKGEKPKNEKDEGNAFTGALKAAKEKGEKTFTVAGKTYDVKTEEDKLDKVNPVAVKKKFDDRKDKDIDNDGDVDSTDKYLHKRRKAISKAVKDEFDLDEGRMKELHGYMEKGMSAQEIAKKMKLDVKTIEALMDEKEVDEKTEKESVKEETLAMRTAKHISDMWAEASKKPTVKGEDKEEEHDGDTTMTGKPMSKVKVAAAEAEKDK